MQINQNNKSGRNLWIVLSLTAVIMLLPGCMQSSESNVPQNSNTNQSVKVSNINTENSADNSANISTVNNKTVSNNNSAQSNKPVQKTLDPPKIVSGGNDLAIMMQVRSKLSDDKDLINSVIVEIKDGNATLTGKVSNQELKTKAEQLTKSVAGVKSVKNNLQVSP